MNVTGTDWTAAPIFVLNCTATDIATLVRTGTNTCDLTQFQMGMPSDGAFSLSFDVMIPEDGLCIGAGDQGQVESAGVCISVGPAGPLGEVEILLYPDGGLETSVSSAGLWTMNVTGTDWTAAPIFVLNCTATDIATLVRTGTNTCDLTQFQMGMPSDGAFSLSFDVMIPEDGLCIGAGDQGQVESAGVCISVD